VPLGALAAGLMGSSGIELVVLLAILCSVAAAAIAWWLIPANAPAIGVIEEGPSA
jgi:hypothetical protein